MLSKRLLCLSSTAAIRSPSLLHSLKNATPLTINRESHIWSVGAALRSSAPASSKMTVKSKPLVENKRSASRVVEPKHLPSLPVPELVPTAERLLKSCQPFAKSDADLQQLGKLLDHFIKDGGVGDKLHKLLKLKASKTSNWLSHDWWMNKAYLEGRDPIIIWSNPSLSFPPVPSSSASNQETVAKFVSYLIASILKFRDFIREGGNPEAPLNDPYAEPTQCMSQYNRIFGTCRIPGLNYDLLHNGSLVGQRVKVVISRNNRFYELDLSHLCDEGNTQGSTLSIAKSLEGAILSILRDSSSPEKEPPIGCFTASPRDDWAKAYTYIDAEGTDAIRDAQFVVSIDHISNSTEFRANYPASLSRQLLCADERNIGNRWFDKTLQVIVATNDRGSEVLGAGLCYEHTAAEAPTIVRLNEYATREMANLLGAGDSIKPPVAQVSPQPLQMLTNEHRIKVTEYLNDALSHYNNMTRSFDLDVLRFEGYGREGIKSMKFSPDSFIQVAINWAYYRTHGRVGACYESAGTRKFEFGRTETIRSLTQGLKQFFEENSYQNLKAAIDSHKKIALDSSNGEGVDRILLGLRCVAEEVQKGRWTWGFEGVTSSPDNFLSSADMELLNELYSHDLFVRSKYFTLSTSQVASSSPDIFMSYGPLVQDGYGCCYNPTKNALVFAISAFTQNNGDTSVQKYKDTLSQTLIDMQKLVVENQSKL